MTARDRTVVMVLALLAVVGLVWFAIVGPRHKQYSAASTELTAAQDQLATAEQSLQSGQVAKEGYDADYSQVAQLGKAVPVDDEVPSLVYQLNSAADDNKIDFRSIKLSSGAGAGSAPAPAPAATPAAGGTSTTSTTDTTATTPAAPAAATAAPATNVAAATLPPGASIGEAGFPTMPFDFVFDGSFFDMSSFLRQLEEFTDVNKDSLEVRGRLLTINGIAISSSRKGFPKIQAGISATAFLLPADQGLTNGATPDSPATPQAASATPGAAGSTPSSPTPAATASPAR